MLKDNHLNINIEQILKDKGLLTKDSIFKDIIENEAVKEVGKIILASAFISGVIVFSLMAPNIFSSLGSLKKIIIGTKKQIKRKREREKMMRTIYNLRSRKLIEWDREGDKIILKITPKGRQHFINNYIFDLKIKKQEKWDKIWRIVLFDIPNNKVRQRDAFRERLKRMNFFQFQKSAFVTPYPCRNELEAVLEYYRLFDYVTYVEAFYISGEERCRKYFKI